MSHKTCLEGFGGNESIAWTSAVSHVGRTSNAFKVTMKLQIFLFLMVVTSRLSVQYLWKYDFAKSSGNLYASCIILVILVLPVPVAARSTAARQLRLWVRIPPGAWMFVCCECCVLSGRGLCDGLITRPEEYYRLWRVVVCDQEPSRMRRLKPATGLWKIQPKGL